ncbi:MAG: biotin-dependent carboxyltransferase family protein [Gammaproteobacteria bacterium]|nr:biotin-dependent carboxyltransferase family protein [Gammaproteobacteria bacterium]
MMRVIAAGTCSTLQDLGRHGWQAQGIGPSGAMDTWAARVANALLDNQANATVLEMCVSGAQLQLERANWFALTGADMDARIGGLAVPMYRPVWLEKGSRLAFSAARRGCRAYLAVRGGFAGDLWLGSTATDMRAGRGGMDGRCLRRDDVLRFRAAAPAVCPRLVKWSTCLALPPLSSPLELALIPGPALMQLDVAERQEVEQRTFTVSHAADRMGLRLVESLPSATRLPAILSQAVAFGAVQLPPDGKPIILGADRQTTGGYPLLGVVAGVDHPGVAQLRSGDGLRFRLTDARVAQSALCRREQQLRRFRLAVQAWWRGCA